MPTSPMREVLQHLRSALQLREGADRTDAELLECFLHRRDTAALEALVMRHGLMVWGVCRRVLRNDHDAEGAFQATLEKALPPGRGALLVHCWVQRDGGWFVRYTQCVTLPPGPAGAVPSPPIFPKGPTRFGVRASSSREKRINSSKAR